MFNWFKKKQRPVFDLPGIGVFSLIYPDYKSWFTRTKLFPGEDIIELTIETHDGLNPTQEQIKSIFEVSSKYEAILSLLFSYLEKVHNKSGLSIDDLKDMYYLSAVHLKSNNTEWWYVLEPGDVVSQYNYFVRYSVVNDKIVWSNMKI